MAKKIFDKLLTAGEFLRWDEISWFIGWLIGRGILVVISFLVGYVGINVVIGFLRWFFGVFF